MTENEKLIMSKIDDSELLEYIDNTFDPLDDIYFFRNYRRRNYMYDKDEYNRHLLYWIKYDNNEKYIIRIIKSCDKLNIPFTIKVKHYRKFIVHLNNIEYIFDSYNLENIERFLKLIRYKSISITQAYYISRLFHETKCKQKKVKLALESDLQSNWYNTRTIRVHFTKKDIIVKENNRVKDINYLNTFLHEYGMPSFEF